MRTPILILDSLQGLNVLALGLGAVCAVLVICAGRLLLVRPGRRAGVALARRSVRSRPLVAVGTESAPKRRGRSVAVLVSDVAATVVPVVGRVTERSEHTLWIELDEEGEVAEGTVLTVWTSELPMGALRPQVEVRKRRSLENGAWELECRFVRTPPWSVRMLFG